MAEPMAAFFTFSNVSASVPGSRLVGDGALSFSQPVVDSRKVTEKALFVPIKGENVDGHDYIVSALKSGAAGSLVSEDFWKVRGGELAGLFSGKAFVVTESPLEALQNFAKAYRRRLLADVKRIGITGSSGKTTFKEILAAILSCHGKTAWNPGNLNSEIGLPMALLAVEPEAQFAVLEMGMNHQGEMDILADLFAPEIAVITNIGTAHIGLLGSRENIAREKKKIFKLLDRNGAAFIWEDDEFFRFLAEGVEAEVLPYGPGSLPEYLGAENRGLAGWNIRFRDGEAVFPLMGEHNLWNALGAVKVALYLGLDMGEIKKGLASVKPLFGRGQVIQGPVSMVLDFYNANPDSFEKALRFFQDLPWEGRKILVAGAMGELGEVTLEAHRVLGRVSGEAPYEARFFFGPAMEAAWETAQSAGKGENFWFADFDKLLDALKSFVKPGDLLLLKGSRSMELERLVEPLEKLYA